MTKDYPLHEYCNLFPEMTEEEFQELVTGMKLTGFKKEEPVILFKDDGKEFILDGRNRYNGALAAKVKPEFKQFKGTRAQALEFVVMKNLKRRHLNAGQRAMIAADLAKCQNSDTTIAEAAQNLGVSRQSTSVAKRLATKSPKLAKQVKDGKKTLNKAATEAGVTKGSKGKDTKIAKSDESKPEPKSGKSLGQICREGYFHKAGGDVDEWADLPVQDRAAWEAAALAVKAHIG